MESTSPDMLGALWQLVVALSTLFLGLAAFALRWLLLIVWIAWWLLAVDWRKAWPFLARGAWMPLVLLMVTAALVWSRLAPSDCDCLYFLTVPNFWWQLGAVGLLTGVALVCGWLQGILGWEPAEIELEPPAEHHHGHGHH